MKKVPPLRRSWLLAMVLDPDRFAKAVASDADVLTLDLEDAVVASRKDEARQALAELLDKGRGAIGGREQWVRINNLLTPWGQEDLEMALDFPIDGLVYPCVRGAEEVWAIRRRMVERGSTAELKLIVETPQSVMNLNDLARVPGVTSLIHGSGDLSMETGISIQDRTSFGVTAAMTVIAARAFGHSVTEGIHLDDWRNPDAVLAYVKHAKLQGFDGLHSFYLPNMKIINEVFTPTAAEVEHAERVVTAFERAQAAGNPAVVLDGKAILVHQYERAKSVIGQNRMIQSGWRDDSQNSKKQELAR